MNWVRAKRDDTRGDIEPTITFVSRNIDWWWINRRFERVRRRKYYDKFLNVANIQTDNMSTVGEVGPGPFGGMIEVCKLDAQYKIFIDYIMEELFNLKFIRWPDNATYVDSPAEKIPLADNSVDILLSFNCLDHGWNVYDCLTECARIGKRCYLAFDCRGDSKNEISIREKKTDYDHYQLLKYDDIVNFVVEQQTYMDTDWKIRNIGPEFDKPFPIAFIETEKC